MTAATENYNYLTPVSFCLDCAQTAKNIRKVLKKELGGTKFSVRSDNLAIRVYWTDGATVEQVSSALAFFKNSNSELSTKYGYAEFLFFERNYSEKMIADTLEFIGNKYDCKGIEMSAERYDNGLCNDYPKGLEGLHSVYDLATKHMRNTSVA